MTSYTIHNPGYTDNAPKYVASKGAFLINENGHAILDAGLAAGCQILGHSHDEIVSALCEQVQQGTIFLNNNTQITTLAELLAEVLPPSLNNFVFCNSGSEATQRALRYARAATGKDKIASFHGGWHGMNEWTLRDDGGRFSLNDHRLPSGIPDSVLQHSILLPYNDSMAFDIIEKNKNELAAICIEPIQGSNPRDDIIPFLRKLEQLCKDNKILVIYDEIISGFRIGLSGATGAWGLTPDIVTYGKILGGGLPVGLVAFTDSISRMTFRDQYKKMLSGGTFSANPLMAKVASTVINILKRQDYAVIDTLSATLRAETNKKLTSLNIPCRLSGIASINRLYFTDQPFKNREQRDFLELNNEFQKMFRNHMMQLNVLWPTNGIVFTGFCHNEQIIKELSNKIVEALKKCIETQYA
ncbi:aminotransferase class III-fold pyridoxal phosphate-dependent enzyme [Aeromonas allosaccharophila]|uniref:aminotransferase class III-fold pyridoxal phosphate-dependent enzyme n=1 Tax=Aeromonas allosaccharophila TaxID=656 RepID=UPI000DD0ADD9|nr:aminotransferase class III-fold pyridoxal phosphate-dependent enzyme [Aeromonas allosaccharophila]